MVLHGLCVVSLIMFLVFIITTCVTTLCDLYSCYVLSCVVYKSLIRKGLERETQRNQATSVISSLESIATYIHRDIQTCIIHQLVGEPKPY